MIKYDYKSALIVLDGNIVYVNDSHFSVMISTCELCLWKKVKTFGSHSTLVLCEIGHRKADWLIGLELFAWGLSPRYLAGLLSTSNLYYHRNWPIGLRVQSYMYQIHETVKYSYISIPIPAFFLLCQPIKIGFGKNIHILGGGLPSRGWPKLEYPKNPILWSSLKNEVFSPILVRWTPPWLLIPSVAPPATPLQLPRTPQQSQIKWYQIYSKIYLF